MALACALVCMVVRRTALRSVLMSNCHECKLLCRSQHFFETCCCDRKSPRRFSMLDIVTVACICTTCLSRNLAMSWRARLSPKHTSRSTRRAFGQNDQALLCFQVMHRLPLVQVLPRPCTYTRGDARRRRHKHMRHDHSLFVHAQDASTCFASQTCIASQCGVSAVQAIEHSHVMRT